jgi:hypothetical protein
MNKWAESARSSEMGCFMKAAQRRQTWLIGALFFCLAVSAVRAQPPSTRPETAALVPLAEVPPALRERVRRVLEQPALYARGPTEEFTGCPELYFWFLENPHRAAAAWRRLGAPCLEIMDRGSGRFGWNDGEGTDICWETIYRSDLLRVWYAEGSARPTPLLPAVPVRVVVVLRHCQQPDATGQSLLYQQADLFVQTESRAANLVTRM